MTTTPGNTMNRARNTRRQFVATAAAGIAVALFCCTAHAADRPGVTFKVFQFPADSIPRIDGNPDDWSMVPDDYAIGMDQLIDDTHPDRKPDPKDLDVKVKVGWGKA